MDEIEIVYSSAHWQLFKQFREEALTIINALAARNIFSAIHGSLARGDVTKKSDIDVIISNVVSSYNVELALTMNGFKIFSRKIAQATPSHTPKAHIYLDVNEKCCVTFPLIPFQALEYQFYNFGGLLELNSINKEIRIPGCNKKLKLIMPTFNGHTESSIIGREEEVSKIIGASVDIINERIKILKKRREIGRTGIVLLAEVKNGEVIEETLKNIAESNPIVRRRLYKK